MDVAWLNVLGRAPDRSDLYRFDLLQRHRVFGPLLAKTNGEFGDFDIHGIREASREAYHWDEQPAVSPSGMLIVVRGASGRDPLTLGDFGKPPEYGPPTRLPSGVLEYPPSAHGQDGAWRKHVLYTFPDGTWIQAEEWMVPRFRVLFSSTAAAPPLPPSDPDVAWEVCQNHDYEKPLTASGKWPESDWMAGITGVYRTSLRFVGDRDMDTEQVLFFGSPASAAQAEATTRARCAQAPCAGLTGLAVEGSVVRYTVRVPNAWANL